MGRSVRHQPGGILSLGRRIEQSREAYTIEALRAGRRISDLGTEAFTWLELKALATYPTPGGPLWTAILGHDWTQERELMALIWDSQQWVLWQNSGGKGRKPKPYPRPKQLRTDNTEQLGGTNSHDLDTVLAWLESRKAKA